MQLIDYQTIEEQKRLHFSSNSLSRARPALKSERQFSKKKFLLYYLKYLFQKLIFGFCEIPKINFYFFENLENY